DAVVAIAGQARLVGHERVARAGKTVEQGRLAHVGAADQDDGGYHVVVSGSAGFIGDDFAVARLDDETPSVGLGVGDDGAVVGARARGEGPRLAFEQMDVAFGVGDHHVVVDDQRPRDTAPRHRVLLPNARATAAVVRHTSVA